MRARREQSVVLRLEISAFPKYPYSFPGVISGSKIAKLSGEYQSSGTGASFKVALKSVF